MDRSDSGKKRDEQSDDGKRRDTDFYRQPAGGLRDPQGEPLRDDEVTEPTEELPPGGLGKKSPDQDLDQKPRHRGS